MSYFPIIGIDPGNDGGIVHINADNALIKTRMPSVVWPKGKKKGRRFSQTNVISLAKTFQSEYPVNRGGIVFLEKSYPFSTSKVDAAFKDWQSGVISTAFIMCGFTVVQLFDRAWQNIVIEDEDFVPDYTKPLKRKPGEYRPDMKATVFNTAKRIFPEETWKKGTFEMVKPYHLAMRNKPLDGLVDAALIMEAGRRILEAGEIKHFMRWNNPEIPWEKQPGFSKQYKQYLHGIRDFEKKINTAG